MKILENKHYPIVMYLLIIIILISIFFNLVGIIEEIEKNPNDNYKKQLKEDKSRIKITGFTISETNKTNSSYETGELYTKKSHIIFYLIIIILGIGILILAISFILPMIKKFTWP